jgi:hypothetical protein
LTTALPVMHARTAEANIRAERMSTSAGGGPLLATAAVDDSAVNGFYSELYGPKSPPLRPYDPCPHGTGVNRGSNGDSPTLEHDAGGCTVVEHGV